MTIDMEQLAKSEVEAWASHDLDKMVAIYTEDCIYEDVALGRIMHGKEEIRAFFKEFLTACPDNGSLEISSSFASNNRMCMEFTMRGTIKGSFLGVQATGKAISIRGVHVCELKGEKVGRVSDYWDTSTLMRQLGLLPSSVEEMVKDHLAAFNSHDAEKMASFWTEDVVLEDVGRAVVIRGRQELKSLLRDIFAAIPDVRKELKSWFCTPSQAVCEMVETGTQTGAIGKTPATGKSYSGRVVWVIEMRDGKISRLASYYDALSFLQQLGLMPEAPY